MKTTSGMKRTVRTQRCRQKPEQEDCFARNRMGNCRALEVPDYPCGKCPFYKPADVQREERKLVYARLMRMERMDLIIKYGVEEE